ncbi:MAG TPA: RNA methyltransferase [Gemmataceae bacterium]|jgi:tRNA/rRNA methyltransferase|nr:RNA methyltransferase [Gemmataceae bacterium]
MLTNARVVLVRPHYSGNLGSVARAMCNFGLNQLTLVEPFADPRSEEARRLATHGEHLLESALTVLSLEDAVADCRVVLATSANVDGIYRTHNYGRPEELFPSFVEAIDDGPCALVFGPEPSGLANAEIARCHGLIRILTDRKCPSLNLSHAVAICLYELRKIERERANAIARPSQKVAPFADQERMFERLRGALTDIHYLWGPKTDSLMHAVRHLIVRARPSPNEVRILFGLARQLRWVAEHGVSRPPDELRDADD